MPQQINLCTMAIALGVFLVMGVALCGTWVWKLDRAKEAIQQSTTAQSREIESLKAAIQLSRAKATPVAPALLKQLQEQRELVVQREKLKEALKEGVFRPGWGHSDRLAWVARSIPAPVWITDVQMDGVRFEVKGFTLEPAALNDWVDKLSISPLMQGLKLATVKVEKAATAALVVPGAAASAASAPATPARAVWAFNLVSAEPSAPTAAASAPRSNP